MSDGRGTPRGPRTKEDRILVTCSSCGALHRARDVLAFEPLCSACARPHPFGLLGMSGPHPLAHEAIDAVVLARAPGNYALGYEDGGTFIVFYVGRDDTDVRARLQAWVGVPSPCPRRSPSAQAPWALRADGPLGCHAPALAAAGTTVDSSYTHFAYGYAGSAAAAFAKECRNYEEFGGAQRLDNAGHPSELGRRHALGLRRVHPRARVRIVRSAPRS